MQDRDEELEYFKSLVLEYVKFILNQMKNKHKESLGNNIQYTFISLEELAAMDVNILINFF